MIEEINPNSYYSPRKLVRMGLVPWKGAMTFNRKLKLPEWYNIFKPFTDTTNGKKKIYIKGENIINFQRLALNGEINISNEIKKNQS